MSFCNEEEFPLDAIFAKMEEVSGLIADLAVNSVLSSTEVIEQLARAQELFTALEEFKDLLENRALKALLCTVLNNLDLDDEIQQAESYVEQITSAIDELDNSLSGVADDLGYDELQEIVNSYFDQYESIKEQAETMIKDILKQIFSVLVSIGAKQSEIDQVIDDSEFEFDIRSYITTLFSDILREALRRYKEKL